MEFLKELMSGPKEAPQVKIYDAKKQNADNEAHEKIFAAIEQDNPKELKAIIGKDPNLLRVIHGATGRTPFTTAIVGWKEKILSFLLGSSTYRQIMRDLEKTDSALLCAAEMSNTELVKSLVQNKLAVNFQDKFGRTALMMGMKPGGHEMPLLLLELQADVNLIDNKGDSALLYGARNRHESGAVSVLFQHSKPKDNHQNLAGVTALMMAAATGHDGLVASLIRRGANIHLQDQAGNTALLSALQPKKATGVAVVSALLEHKADILDKNKAGETVLILKAGREAGLSEGALVDRLVNSKAELNAEDDKGNFPLLLATQQHNGNMIGALLEAKADPYKRNKYGQSALAIAICVGKDYLFERAGVDKSLLSKEAVSQELIQAAKDGNIEWAQKLLHFGADVTMRSAKKSMAPLHAAAYQGHLAMVKLLLDKKADIHQPGHWGATPLIWAAKHGRQEVVMFLLEKKASLAAANEKGMTPLHAAVVEGHFEVVKLLVEQQASLAATNEEKITPQSLAESKGHGEIVRFLQAKILALQSVSTVSASSTSSNMNSPISSLTSSSSFTATIGSMTSSPASSTTSAPSEPTTGSSFVPPPS